MKKKSVLKDAFDELKALKEKSVEIAKQELILENAEMLEKVSAKIFEKLVNGEDESNEEDILSSEPVGIDNQDFTDRDSEEIDLDNLPDESNSEISDEDEYIEIDFEDEKYPIYENKQLFNKKKNMSKNTDLRNVDFKTLLENYDAMSEEDTFVVEDYDTFDDDLNEDEMPLSDEEVSAMLDENEFGDLRDDEFELDLGLDSNEPRFRERTGFGDIDNEDDEFDEALNSMSLEELMDLRNKMQEDDGGDGESYQDGDGGNHSHRGFAVEAGHDYLNENKEMFTEEEINDILEGLEKEDMKEEDEKTSEKEEEKIEENHSSTSQTKKQIGGAGVGKKEGKPERRSNLSEEMEALKKENADLKSKLKTLEENSAEKEKETETLKESFNTKIKTFEDKIKEITLTTYKAAHANKLLLEHTMTHSDKTNVLTQLTNATTKQEVIDTYNTLLQEFSNKKTGKDGLLNESIENRVNKVYRTDKVILSESETTYADRFKQLIAKKQIKNNKK